MTLSQVLREIVHTVAKVVWIEFRSLSLTLHWFNWFSLQWCRSSKWSHSHSQKFHKLFFCFSYNSLYLFSTTLTAMIQSCECVRRPPPSRLSDVWRVLRQTHHNLLTAEEVKSGASMTHFDWSQHQCVCVCVFLLPRNPTVHETWLAKYKKNSMTCGWMELYNAVEQSCQSFVIWLNLNSSESCTMLRLFLLTCYVDFLAPNSKWTIALYPTLNPFIYFSQLFALCHIHKFIYVCKKNF